MVDTEIESLVNKAIKLYRKGHLAESRNYLRDHLLEKNALLWLAKVSPDPQEAASAAELALKLDPDNEVAQRAVSQLQPPVHDWPEPGTAQSERLAAIAASTGLTLTQARAVNWPFRGLNRPTGQALDDETITLRDLAWALEGAKEARIQAAARTILLTHLAGAEPKEPPPPLKVVVGSRFAEKQERRQLLYLGLITGFAVTVMFGKLRLFWSLAFPSTYPAVKYACDPIWFCWPPWPFSFPLST